ELRVDVVVDEREAVLGRRDRDPGADRDPEQRVAADAGERPADQVREWLVAEDAVDQDRERPRRDHAEEGGDPDHRDRRDREPPVRAQVREDAREVLEERPGARPVRRPPQTQPHEQGAHSPASSMALGTRSRPSGSDALASSGSAWRAIASRSSWTAVPQSRRTRSRTRSPAAASAVPVAKSWPVSLTAARPPSTGSGRRTPAAMCGHTRKRNSWHPRSWSSSASRSRAEPNGPVRASRSQRANSPPASTVAPTARSPPSSSSSRSPVERQRSLQTAPLSGRGTRALSRPGRHGVSPWRSRPRRRAAGWKRQRSAVRAIRGRRFVLGGRSAEARDAQERRLRDGLVDAEPGEDGEEQVPLDRQRQRGQRARRARVERLEEGAAPGAVVDAPPALAGDAAPVPVDAPAPARVPAPVVLLRPLLLEERLGLAVAVLLSQERAQRAPPAMPDEGGRDEADRPAALVEPPADVDVVAGRPETRVEPADLLERATTEDHVAAGHVLGLAVGHEHVVRAARRPRDAAREAGLVLGRDVRPAERRVRRGHERRREVRQPVAVGPRVVVEVRDELAARRLEPTVARVAEPLALRPDHAGAELARDVARPVGRAVVDDDALEVGVVELGHALAGLPQRRGAVVRADDGRHGRPAELAGDRNVGEGV